MSRWGALLLGMAVFGLTTRAKALDPLPDVWHGPGFLSWQLPADAKLWSMEVLLERLRDPDLQAREEAMREIGFQNFEINHIPLFPKIVQPVHVDLKWLGIARQKEAILSIPLEGKFGWVLVFFRQDSNDEAYWRPFQFMKFDTDPVAGLKLSYPDILGDQSYFVGVQHLAEDDVYGRRAVQSYFKYDEKQMRLCYQETDDYYRAGKFQGDPQRLEQELSFKGDQIIRRKLTIKTYPYVQSAEFEDYADGSLKPRHVQHATESFAFDPQNFSFYDPDAEIHKLVLNPSAFVRREAARRLGEILKTAPPQLEHAMLHDSDAYVRAQCALALENINDTDALPAVKRALRNYNESDTVDEAFQEAYDHLTTTAASEAKPKHHASEPSDAAKMPEPSSPSASLGTLPPEEEPKLNEKMK